ncbi:MAG: hypothetical protein PHH83_04270 [Patescibacteria group bacterium]|nr:hypothetical protein [Patescibacteria group bacterium]
MVEDSKINQTTEEKSEREFVEQNQEYPIQISDTEIESFIQKFGQDPVLCKHFGIDSQDLKKSIHEAVQEIFFYNSPQNLEKKEHIQSLLSNY